MESASVFTTFMSLAYLILIISTVIIVLTEPTRPSKTMAWLLVLLFVPAIGLVLYYVFGYNPRRRHRSTSYENFKKELFSKIPNISDYLAQYNFEDKVLPKYATLVNLLTRNNDSYVLYGSDVEVMITGKRKFEALIEDLGKAKHHIHLEYFYFRRDHIGMKIRDILMKKAAEGVCVRFIYENIANIDINPRFYYKMRKAGVEVLPFSKVSLPWIRRNLNSRDHRKIVVIDGEIGYTGGMNIGDEYATEWRDTHLRILGQGVHGLQMNFLNAWYDSGGELPEMINPYFPACRKYSENLMQVVPEAPDSQWPYLLLASTHIVNNADRYIYIQTPYYMPSDSLLDALKSAALSGVDVRVMVSKKADIFFMDPATHSYYEESLKAGIRIYEYLDTFVHAKTMVVDDYISVIGSANLDFRSLELSFEINTYLYDPKIAAYNYTVFCDDMENCREVILEEWLKRPWWKKIIESIMRLFSPLL
ncbi:MAG: cardiolipin synthase [Bacteroidales bacterium]|jgi:cardiolipin synthase|nr:cardiolipin synthase [Bacteroidales bacterium]